MQNINQSRGILLVYSFTMAVSSVLILGWMLSSSSESDRALLFGQSLPRLVIALGLLIASFLFTLLAFRAFRDPVWSAQFVEKWFGGKGPSHVIGWLSGISFGVSWIGCFLPAYRMGAYAAYGLRIQPLMVFILIASLATLIVYFLLRVKDLNPAPLKPVLPLFAICLFILAGMFYSGFGVVSLDDFWYGAGVPILVSQIIMVVIGGVLFLHFGSQWTSKRADILICTLIYASTAFLWMRAPLQKSFLFTGAYPPNHVFYPFADAALFDGASQFALIGQKLFIFNSLFFERPLYLSFLTYLHAMFGQDYELLMAIQAGIFAIFPVLIYLIGKSLNVRTIGIVSAMVAMLRGINAIAASNTIDMANPKMILTDFPTAIGIALLILMICAWQNQPDQKYPHLLWIGGIIGSTLMLRTNALILLVFTPFYILTRFTTQWKKWLLGSSLIVLGVIAITLPWEIRNLSLGGQMYGPIVTKFRGVIEQRYRSPASPTGFLPQEPALVASALLKNTQTVSSLYQDTAVPQSTQPCDAVICFSTNHFLHNILTSVLILPTTPALDDLRHLIRERDPHYWQADWNGTLTSTAMFFLVLNLFFITSGITLGWVKKRWQGLAPLAIFVVYNMSNGLARTSGGRYIVPVDWVIILYYMLGVFYVITWLANTVGIRWNIFSTASGSQTSNNPKAPFSNAAKVLVTLLLIGSLLPLSESIFLPRYANIDPIETLASKRALIEETGMQFYDLDTFLQNPDARIFIGRVLYPRSYKMNQGEFKDAFYPYAVMDFPRTAFKLIGPAGDQSIVLPGATPQYLPHTSDALVIGCKGQNYIDALVVIVLDENQAIYTRSPASELQCPLQQPVCNNNSVCQ